MVARSTVQSMSQGGARDSEGEAAVTGGGWGFVPAARSNSAISAVITAREGLGVGKMAAGRTLVSRLVAIGRERNSRKGPTPTSLQKTGERALLRRCSPSPERPQTLSLWSWRGVMCPVRA